MKKLLLSIFLLSLVLFASAQDEGKKAEKIKKGWNFGAIPVVAYDTDIGFKYGGLVNFFNYGDGSIYPKYRQSIFMEISYTTKGTGTNRLFFDSQYLFPNKPIRVTSDLSYLTEQAINFYGFNGYESNYNSAFENQNDTDYISRVYYRHARKMFRFTTDVQGKIGESKFRWLLGFGHFNYAISTVNIDRLNKKKDSVDMLPSVNTIYDEYVNLGIIKSEEANGGHQNIAKLGIVYDSRDLEANPNKGIWAEVILFAAPKFLDNNENQFLGISATFRNYLTLVPKRLTFAYRLGYKSNLSGSIPFYFDPYILNSYSPNVLPEGLGGAKTIRGLLRNRVVGDGFAYGNFEFRYKFYRFVVGNQNVYLALNGFSDIGTVTDPYAFDVSNLTQAQKDKYFNLEKDKLHFTVGAGFHAAMNENFVLSINYGRALDAQDGKSGLYIATNWIF